MRAFGSSEPRRRRAASAGRRRAGRIGERQAPASDTGVALIVVVFALTLVAALAASLALTSATEALIDGSFLRAHDARYAAEAGLERALAELPSIADWNALVAGAVASTFVDGPPIGVRQLPGGSTLDLARVVNVANCGMPTACTATQLAANATGQRSWGANNPTWHLFAYGPVTALAPGGALRSSSYIVVLVGDDPSETDGDPATDANGAIAIRSEAFGPAGAHQTVEAIVERPRAAGWPVRTRTQLMGGIR